MTGSKFVVPRPCNENNLAYLPGSKERQQLEAKIIGLKAKKLKIPIIIGGKEIHTNRFGNCVIPHNHQHVLGEYHMASKEEAQLAIDAALEAREEWAQTQWYDRVAIFLKAAELLAGPFRATMNAATMLNLSKNAFQSEIDAAAELIDFFRFNSYYVQEIYETQPHSVPGEWNRIEYRPLEGFVFAVSPFNFVSLMGYLPSAPAIMGNVVVWKPASSAVYTSYFVMKLLMDAGLPPGVINFIPGSAAEVGNPVLTHPSLAGLHFTGSTSTFRGMWKTMAENIDHYSTFPRLIGETGGKDFIVAHKSANIDALVTALVRGPFEFQGQKCSAASRAYIPESLWPVVKEKLLSSLQDVKVGDVEDYSTLVSAVIDKTSFERIKGYIDYAKKSSEMDIISGGTCDDSVGYFVTPTVVVTSNPKSKLMEEEIFGPVLTIFVYPDKKFEETLHLVDETSPYALTGSIFASERNAIVLASKILVNAAGNFYINDKPTGAVIGRQPFGGARASGTNDKSGSKFNLMRWTSPRTIKENFVPPTDFMYDYMKES